MTKVDVYSKSNELMTNSVNVSEVFDRDHREVKRSISRLHCSENFKRENYSLSTYKTSQGKVLECIDMTFDGFVFLCMGFKGKRAAEFKEAYIKEFNRMRAEQNAISNLVDEVSREGIELKEAGKKWSELGHQIRSSKKVHKKKVESVINEIQIKLDI